MKSTMLEDLQSLTTLLRKLKLCWHVDAFIHGGVVVMALTTMLMISTQ